NHSSVTLAKWHSGTFDRYVVSRVLGSNRDLWRGAFAADPFCLCGLQKDAPLRRAVHPVGSIVQFWLGYIINMYGYDFRKGHSSECFLFWFLAMVGGSSYGSRS